MKQIVFIKQVPASTEIRIDPVSHTLIRSGAKSQTNPDDLHALQTAIEIRKQTGGTIVAVTMGPPQAESVLREALMFGADEAILITDRAFAGSDTWSTSYILAQTAVKIGGASLLIFGKQAIDGDTAQVGPGVAAQMRLPLLAEMYRLVQISDTDITVEKITDRGTQILNAKLPCVITVIKESNVLPAPTLRNWEEAQRKSIIRWSAADLKLDTTVVGLQGSPTQVVRTEVPDHKSAVIKVNVTELAKVISSIKL